MIDQKPPALKPTNVIEVCPSFWARYGTETVLIIIISLVTLLIASPLLIITLVRYFKNKKTKLVVDAQRSTLLVGLLTTSEVQVRHKDVRSVMLNQGIWDRMFGVHRIRISSSGTGVSEIDVSGIPRASEIKERIHQFND